MLKFKMKIPNLIWITKKIISLQTKLLLFRVTDKILSDYQNTATRKDQPASDTIMVRDANGMLIINSFFS